MSMPAHIAARRWTEDEFYSARDAAPANERWELVDGEVLVTPGAHWGHQDIVVRLLLRLGPFIHRHSLGTLLTAPCDVRFEQGLVVQPDISVVPLGHLRVKSDTVKALTLAIEVLSPSSARFDRVVKRPHYLQHGVSEYWIVDVESRIIERWQPGDDRPAIIADSLIWLPAEATEPFVLDVVGLFSDVPPQEA
ncbi:MAG: Uma2 family endonuclease [bacterium]